jgi:glycosyltransferase involved in cell wall biosynthesis
MQNKKIRILHIITRMIVGGAQENTLISVEGLGAINDYEVTLLTGPSLGPEGSLLEQQPTGFKLQTCVFLRRNINIFNDLLALFSIYRFIKKGNYDIVHTHSSKAGILGRIAAHWAKVPVIVHTVHGLPFFKQQNSFLNKLYIKCEKYAADFTSRIICVSPSLADDAVKAGIAPKNKFETVYSGIVLESYKRDPKIKNSVKQRLMIDKNTIVIGKVARLFHLKGHEFLLEAAYEINKNLPDFKILLIGDGILRQALEKKVRQLDLMDKIIFLGLVRPEAIPYYLQAVDILAHVSLHEGLPRAIVQGFALGIPAVCFDIDGAKDIVNNNVNGILVPPKDTSQLARALTKLMQDKEMAKKMGENGCQIVKESFDANTMVNSLDFIYKSLLKKCGN